MAVVTEMIPGASSIVNKNSRKPSSYWVEYGAKQQGGETGGRKGNRN